MLSDIQPYLYRRPNVGDSAATLIPNAEAFLGADVLARPDGLFVFRVKLDDQGSFNPADLDELSYVVAMVSKSKLGHTHYHHNMPGKGSASALPPSQILYVPPVQVRSAGWTAAFRHVRFSDGDALGAMTLGALSEPRAIHELRHRFIRVDDFLSFRVRLHRRVQAKRLSGFLGKLSFVAYGVLAALIIFLLVFPNPSGLGMRDLIGLALTAAFVAVCWHFRARIARWDVPVIRLLRTAHGFFTAADPLNRVIEEIERSRDPDQEIDCFKSLLDNLHSRIEGEQHRIGMGQNWLALSLGAASLVAAVSALNNTDAPADRAGQAGAHATHEWADIKAFTVNTLNKAKVTVERFRAKHSAPQVEVPGAGDPSSKDKSTPTKAAQKLPPAPAGAKPVTSEVRPDQGQDKPRAKDQH